MTTTQALLPTPAVTPPSFKRLAFAITCIVLIGFSVGRFVLFTPESTSLTASAPRQASDPAATIKDLERTVRRNPADVSSLQQLAALYLQRSLETLDTSYYPLADRALDQADAVTPDLDRTLIARGVLALGRHQFDEARVFGEKVIARSPTDADALSVLVDASVELGHYDAAAAYLQRLLDLRPGLPAYSRLSYVRELNGDDAGAIIAMREAAVASGPSGNAAIATFLGDLQFARGDLGAADAEYQRALQIAPGYANAVYSRVKVYAARGDVQVAVDLLTEVDSIAPSPHVAELLVDLELARGNARDADHWSARVAEMTQEQIDAGEVTDLEFGLFRVEHATTATDIAAALLIAERAYAARPDNVFVNDLLAWALVRSGDAAAARPYVDRALRLGTQNARMHYHAAVVYEATGELDRARFELTYAFERNPWFSFANRDAMVEIALRLGVPTPPAWDLGATSAARV